MLPDKALTVTLGLDPRVQGFGNGGLSKTRWLPHGTNENGCTWYSRPSFLLWALGSRAKTRAIQT